MRYVFEEEGCQICRRHPDQCDCKECQKCGVIGDKNCHSDCGHPFEEDTVYKLVWDGVGVESLAEYMRAVERHSDHSVFIKFHDGLTLHSSSCEDRMKAKDIPLHQRYSEIGVAGIAWDGTDWEWSDSVKTDSDTFGELGAMRVVNVLAQDFEEALAEHRMLI